MSFRRSEQSAENARKTGEEPNQPFTDESVSVLALKVEKNATLLLLVFSALLLELQRPE
jgi:hypothetical protein